MGKKDIRENFRKAVFKRDGYKCKICGRSDVKLDAHHIVDRHDMPNGGYVASNGISLCDTDNGCHMKAEKPNQSNEVWAIYNASELYFLINSSFDKAYSDSKNLK